MSEPRRVRTLRARYVLAGEGAPLADGFVACDGPTIRAVGRWPQDRPGASIPGATGSASVGGTGRQSVDHTGIASGTQEPPHGATASAGMSSATGSASADDTIDFGSAIILPGFVNAHTHLEFSDLSAPLAEPGGSFADWIRAVVSYRRGRSESQRHAAVRRGLEECRAAGTTTLGEIATAGWPQDAFASADDDAESINSIVLLELLGLSAERTAENLAAAKNHLSLASTPGFRPGLSPHAPYTVRPELVQQAAALARAQNTPLAMHLAESAEELELLQTGGGPLRELLEEFGAWDPAAIPRGAHPLDYLRLLADAPHSLIIHGTYLDDEEIAFVAARPDRMAVVYCPRTQARLTGHARPYPLEKLLAAGVTVALGTDSRASNPDLNLLEELRAVAANHSLRPDQLLALATSSAARALGQQQQIGTLAPGKSADLTVIRVPSGEADPFELLLDPRSAVIATIRRGQIISGSAR